MANESCYRIGLFYFRFVTIYAETKTLVKKKIKDFTFIHRTITHHQHPTIMKSKTNGEYYFFFNRHSLIRKSYQTNTRPHFIFKQGPFRAFCLCKSSKLKCHYFPVSVSNFSPWFLDQSGSCSCL